MLGVLANESYFSRVPVYLRGLARLRRGVANVDVVIVFSSEHALLVRSATMLQRTPPAVIREFGDVPRARG